MLKRLLLVDDEKLFLESLKDGMAKYENIFNTDICFSVKEAKDLYNRNHYDLIISDIRIPGESGLDLFLYLRDQNYQGGFIVMTAYSSPEILKRIKSLGGIDVMLKPFDFSWFSDKILNFFKEEEGVSGTIDSIALTSLLQMINLEKKSLVVKVENKTSEGFLYFNKGEIVHAEYQGETGEEALSYLLKLKRGRFSLLNPNEKKMDKKSIDTSFMVLMMNMMKIVDESLKDNKDNILKDKNKKNIKEEVNMDIRKLTEAVEYLKDQLGNGLLNTDIWATDDGQSLASYNSKPKAVALFNKLTQQMANVLSQSEEDFVELGRYYLIDLIGDHMVIILYMGEYQWGLLFNKNEVQLGLLLNIVIPKIIDTFEEAITG